MYTSSPYGPSVGWWRGMLFFMLVGFACTAAAGLGLLGFIAYHLFLAIRMYLS